MCYRLWIMDYGERPKLCCFKQLFPPRNTMVSPSFTKIAHSGWRKIRMMQPWLLFNNTDSNKARIHTPRSCRSHHILFRKNLIGMIAMQRLSRAWAEESTVCKVHFGATRHTELDKFGRCLMRS